MPKGKKYRRKFKKTVYGFATVNASSLEDAQIKFESGDVDEFEHNSDYEWNGEVELR